MEVDLTGPVERWVAAGVVCVDETGMGVPTASGLGVPTGDWGGVAGLAAIAVTLTEAPYRVATSFPSAVTESSRCVCLIDETMTVTSVS